MKIFKKLLIILLSLSLIIFQTINGYCSKTLPDVVNQNTTVKWTGVSPPNGYGTDMMQSFFYAARSTLFDDAADSMEGAYWFVARPWNKYNTAHMHMIQNSLLLGYHDSMKECLGGGWRSEYDGGGGSISRSISAHMSVLDPSEANVVCSGVAKCKQRGEYKQEDTTCEAEITISSDYEAEWDGELNFLYTEETYTDMYGFSGDDGYYVCPEQNGGSYNGTENLKKKWSHGESIETTSVKPYKAWHSGRIYGSANENEIWAPSSTASGETENQDASVTISSYTSETGSVIWPIFQGLTQDYVSVKWEPFYFVAFPSRVANPLIVYGASNIGDNKAIKLHSLDIQTTWNGWTSTIKGLEDTGILDANGNDKNCVVNGGSTIFIKASDTAGSTTDKIRFLVNGFIPLYNYNASPQNDREAWCYDDMIEDAANPSVGAQQYPFSMYSAWKWAKVFEESVTKNLANCRLDLMCAEGIYRQGQEDEFEKVAVCVKGSDKNNPEMSAAELADNMENRVPGANGTFGSFNGTAGNGNGNLLDDTHTKYEFHSCKPDGSETSVDYKDKIQVKMVPNGEHFLVHQMYVTPFTDSSTSVANDAKVYFIEYDLSEAFARAQNSNKCLLDLNKSPSASVLASTLGAGSDDVQLISHNIQTMCNNERFAQAESLTGWASNHLLACDYGIGGPVRASGNGAMTTGHKAGWYNEGFTDVGLLEFQFEYELDFNNTAKWMTIDPGLCGQAINQYDLNNWTDNNNDGVVDGNITEAGAMKDKVRTLRVQLSSQLKEDSHTEDQCNYVINSLPSGIKTYFSNFIYNKTALGQNEPSYISTLVVVDEFTADYYGTGATPHVAAVPVFMNFNTSMKSKFFYLTNSTVEDLNLE